MNYRRTTLFTAIVLAIIAPSIANASSSSPYVGFTIGQESMSNKYHEKTLLIDNKYDDQLTGFNWGIKAGYLFHFGNSRFSLATEVNWQKSNTKLYWDFSASANNRTFRKTSSFSADVLPGYDLNAHNRIALILGWVQSRFNHQTDSSTNFGANFTNKPVDGYQYGLQYLTKLTAHFALNFSYIHSEYNTINTNVGSSNFSYGLSSDEYATGVSYYFNSDNLGNMAKYTPMFNGFYAGAGVGRSTVNLRRIFSNATTSNSYPWNMRGGLLNAFVGYRQALTQHWNVAIEPFYEISSTHFKNDDLTTPSNQFEIKQHRSYGVSLLPGYMTSKSNLVYLDLGARNAKFEKIGSTSGGQLFNTDVWGFDVGVGDSMSITKHINLRLSYVYTIYNSFETYGANTTQQYLYKPRSSRYNLSFVYNI